MIHTGGTLFTTDMLKFIMINKSGPTYSIVEMWLLAYSPVLSSFQPPNSTQVLLQPSSTRWWLKPHLPISELAIVMALSRQPLAQTGINASLPEMGAMQGKRTIFSTRSCIGGQQWPTLSQPTCFQSGAQRRPCCLYPSGAATHLPLSRPFCCRRTYLQRSLQEVTSQHESFMPDISGYIRERFNGNSTNEHAIWFTQINNVQLEQAR